MRTIYDRPARRFFFGRFLSPLLIAAIGLGLPSYTYALRPIERGEAPAGLEELENALQNSGLEETLEQLIQEEFSKEAVLKPLVSKMQPRDWSQLSSEGVDDRVLRGLAESLGVIRKNRSGVAEAMMRAIKRARKRFALLNPSAPLAEPIQMIFTGHLDEDGPWIKQQLAAASAHVSIDRPIVVWIEHMAPEGFPIHYPEFEFMLAQSLGVSPAAVLEGLARQPLDPVYREVVRSNFERILAMEPPVVSRNSSNLFGQALFQAISAIPNQQRVQVKRERPSFEGYVMWMQAEAMQRMAGRYLAQGQKEKALEFAHSFFLLREKSVHLRDGIVIEQVEEAYRAQPDALQILVRGEAHGTSLPGSLSGRGIGHRAANQHAVSDTQLNASLRYHLAGEPSLDTLQGQRFLFEVLLYYSVRMYLAPYGVDLRLFESLVNQWIVSLPDDLLGAWVQEGISLGVGSMRGFGVATWNWFSNRRVEMGNEGQRFYAAIQTKLGGLEEAVSKIAGRVRPAVVGQGRLIGFGPSRMESAASVMGLMDRVKAGADLPPFLVLVGKEAPAFRDHPAVLVAAAGMEEAAIQLAAYGTGLIEFAADTEEGIQLQLALQDRAGSMEVRRWDVQSIVTDLLRWLLALLGDLDGAAGRAEVEALYGTGLEEMEQQMKELAGLGV